MERKQKQSYNRLQTTQMKRGVRLLLSLPCNLSKLIISAVRELRRDVINWLSPPDPSVNHNIARKAHYKGTATWFFQGGIFKEWKSSPSLLWIHGKRTLLFSNIVLFALLTLVFVAGSGKSVLWFVIFCCCCLHRLK